MFLDKPINRIKISETLRQFIIDEREKAGLTATGLANKMERPQSWIAQIENGRTKTIKNQDLVSIFSTILELDAESVDKFLIKHVDKINQHVSNRSFNNDVQVSVLKIEDNKEDEKELKKQYNQMINHLNEGLNLFFDKIDNKKDAIQLLGSFIVNLHCDMGFTLSVSALPLCRMERADQSVKSDVFHTIATLLKENGMDCSADDDDDEHDEEK